MPAGMRQLDEHAVDLVVRVQLGDGREHLLLGGRLGEPYVMGADARLRRGLVLEPDVDLRGRVLADEHGGQAEPTELLDLAGDLGADARRERLPVHERCGHPGAEDK